MIKALATDRQTGRQLLVLGLSFGNLDKFRAEPGDTFIRIDGAEMDLGLDILICSGKTEAHLAAIIKPFLSDKTKVVDSRLGATGDHPRGKLTDSDQGGLRLAVGQDPDGRTVIVDFGKDLSWIGLDKAEALNFANAVIRQANALK